MPAPTVSIVVPVYNVAPYVNKCLASVASQTFGEIEVIVVDDGSTDGSGDICDGWARRDDRFRVIHQENRGLSAARNTGLDATSGEYVQFVDSDDWVNPCYTESLLRAAEGTGCPCVICGYSQDRSGRWSTQSPCERPTVLSSHDCLRAILDERRRRPHRIGYTVWNRIYHRSLFAEGGARFAEGRVYEDVLVTFPTIWASRRVALLPDILYHQHCREGNITSTASERNAHDAVDACMSLRADVVDNCPDLAPLVDAVCERSRIRNYVLLASIEDLADKDAEARLRSEALSHRRDLMLPQDLRYLCALLLVKVCPRTAPLAYSTWRRIRGLNT